MGAVCWQGVADEMPDALAVDYGGVRAPDWYEGVAARVSAQLDSRPWIAALHSGAGGFAPALAQASCTIAGFVFVDAGLPYPGRSIVEEAPAGFVARLRERTTDGRLAPWSRWFDEDPLARLIPNADVRAALKAAEPRAPFAYLKAVSPASDAWERLPAAYLQLSANYEAAAARAEARGWPVRRIRLHHLAMASHPAEVAAPLAELAQLVANTQNLLPTASRK